jgi:hypothetical protein
LPLSAGSASAAIGTVATTTTGAAASSANSLTIDYSFTQHLDAPHPTLVSYYDWWYGWVSYYSGDMYAQSTVNVSFTLDAADVGYTYSLTAALAQTGTSQMVLFASLYDQTGNMSLYSMQQYNPVSTDAAMGMGTGAQLFSYNSGSAAGDLIAGHTYSYSIGSYIRHYQAAAGETAADARGTFGVNLIGPEVAAVPEPSSLVLLAFGALPMLWLIRRRTGLRS